MPGILWTLVIALLTLMPGNYVPRVITFLDWLSADKVLHFLLFGIYLYLLTEGFHRQTGSSLLSRYAVIWGLVIGIIFAFLIEVMQRHVIPGRNGNIYDFLADLAGSLLGVACWYIAGKIGNKKLRSSEKYN